ncbi:MAG: hypothetical protein U0169_03190 [Polyangiaceae bacterium]
MRTTRGRDRTPGRARSLGLAVTWVATILGGIGTVPGSVHAQPSAAARRAPRIPELAVPNAPRAADAARAENALLRRFGLDVPQGLTKGDSPDDWVRAVERARSIGTDDAVAFLVSTAAADDDGPRGSAIVDLALARALARVPPTPAVQKALEDRHVARFERRVHA